ncbi:MAG: pantoate--beta-alanine ligase [Ignavibacteria bacterium]|nr:pantoate--beta-alanine ligase [Ignavibacteria bacterium]
MKVIKNIKAMQEIAEFLRRTGRNIGFVPTMGYLHEGHVNLMIAAKDECDILITSIFVNPVQFLPGEDFEKYPRDFMRDYYVCKQAGVDYIFNPEPDEVYGENYKTFVNVNDLSERLEGKYRPGHFTGVATVVMKFFNITKPHFAYFGQKDAQQVAILSKMVSDLNVDVEIKVCETLREESGLAMSSRNVYLSDKHRNEATILNEVLNVAKNKILTGDYEDAKTLKREMKEYIETKTPDCSLQYIAITDNYLLKKIDDLSDYEGEVLISLAAFFGKTRLIDNILFTKKI